MSNRTELFAASHGRECGETWRSYFDSAPTIADAIRAAAGNGYDSEIDHTEASAFVGAFLLAATSSRVVGACSGIEASE